LAGGTLLGIGAGYNLNRRYTGFRVALPSGKTNGIKILARGVLGIAGITLVFFVLAAIDKLLYGLLDNDDLFTFTSFLLGGLWISVAAPWVFVKLRLAAAEAEHER
jgi:hypothetical protein